MKETVRFYSVGGVKFSVEMRSPWEFMEYSSEVAERIAAAARGDLLPVQPVRAGDDVPSRTFVRSMREIIQADLRYAVDLSQYEPFRIRSAVDADFKVTVELITDEDVSSCVTQMTPLWEFTDEYPAYSVYGADGGYVIKFCDAEKKTLGTVVGAGSEYTVYLPQRKEQRYHYPLILNSAIMMIFLMAVSREHVLMVHSSVISRSGEAYMFFGVSGTGKSTHSRLWLDNIEGSELLNDDNPLIVFENGIPYVYGTPWSGKTPCYRNIRRKIKSLVFLEQSPVNSISPLGGVPSLIKMLASVSSPVWDPNVSDRIDDDVAELLTSVPAWLLKCRPDAEAALLCQETIK